MMCDHRDSLITMTTVTANIMIPATLTVTRTVPPPSAGPQPECRGRRWPAPPWPRPAARAVGRRPGNWPARIQVTDGPLADRLLVSEQLRADIRVTEAGINIPGAPLLNASRARTWRAEQRRSSRCGAEKQLQTPALECRALELQSKTSHRENQQMAVLKNLHLPVNLW